MPVPTLTTERLILRPWRDSDLDALAAYEADRVAMQYIGDGSVYGPEHAAATMAGYRAEWERWGHGRWAVELTASPGPAGSCGFVRWHQGQPDERPELAYGYRREHWGNGIATEAARVALEWGFGSLSFAEVVALTHPENAASRRVLAKLGFVAAGTAEGRAGTMSFFTLSKARFEESGLG